MVGAGGNDAAPTDERRDEQMEFLAASESHFPPLPHTPDRQTLAFLT